MKTVDQSNNTMKRFGFTLLLTLLLSMLGNNAWAADQTLTVYDGTYTYYGKYYPVALGEYDEAWRNQTIIPAGVLTAMNGNNIKSITFYTSYTGSWTTTQNVTVKLSEVSYEHFGSSNNYFTNTSSATSVYTGKLTVSGGKLTITFSTFYSYTGGTNGNLLIDITGSGAGTKSPSDIIFYGVSGNYTGLVGRAENSMGGFGYQYPKTTFTYGPSIVPPTYTAPTAISGLVYTGSAQTLIEAGTVTGGTMEYSLDPLDDTTWSASLPTGTNAGTYNVYYRIDGDASHEDVPYDAAHKVTVTIAKAPPTYTAPTVKEGLAYDGFAQVLITAGSTEHGTLEYSLNGSAWTTDVSTITGTNAGNYSIDYRLIGDANHLDVPSRFIIAKIERRDITKTTGYADDKYVTVTTTDQTWTGNLVNISGIYTIVLDTDPSSTPYSLTASDYDVFVTIGETPVDVKDAGRYTIVFVGQGNFDGTVTRTFDVKKDVEDFFTGVTLDIPTQVNPLVGPLVPNITVYDEKSHVTLKKGVDYSVKYFESDASHSYDKSATEVADLSTLAQGKYWVTVTGLPPKYTGSVDKPFYVVNEYQAQAATATNPAIAFHVDVENPGTPDNSPKGKVKVGAATGTAIDAASQTVVIPATISVDVADKTFIFDVADIENGAFDGCSLLHYIDATAMTDYTPSKLDRQGGNAPFKGLPKQALVFLSGDSYPGGENYIYKTGTDEYHCDILKIYDDVNAVQTGFDDATAAQWGFMNPYEFTAEKVVNTRVLNAEVNGKQQGYTTCLPYTLPITDAFKAYTLEASKANVVGFTEVTGTLASMTPYVLIPAASGELLSTTNATIVKTYNGATAAYEAPASLSKTSSAVSGQALYTIKGTVQYLSGTTSMYIMQANNVWNQATASDWPGPCVLPMRVYIEASGTAPARLFSTFVKEIENGKLTMDNDEVYDLSGRRVKNPQRGSIYIVNGQKMRMK